MGDPLGSSLQLPFFKKFEQSHPGITVKFADVPAPNGNYTKYVTDMAAGRGPDVIFLPTFNPPVPEWAANGLIQPLDAYAKQLGVSTNASLPWVQKMQTFHGHTWAFVQDYDSTLFVWNKDAFKAAGLDPNRPPRTIAELDAYTAKLTKFDSKGNILQLGMVPWAGQLGTTFGAGNDYGGDPQFFSMLFGGSIYDTVHQKYTINQSANVRALNWMAQWAKKLGGVDKVNAFTSRFVGNNDPIYTGKVAMEFVGDWVPAFTFKPYAPKNFNYGVAAPPTVPGVPYGTNMVVGSGPIVMPTGTKHPKEAAELMQYMVSAVPVLQWAIGESNMPPTRAAAFDPSLVKAWPYMAATDVGTARAALTNPKMLMLFPNSSIYDYVKTTYSNAMAQVEYGRSTAQAALDLVQKQVDQREITSKQQNPAWYRTGD